MQRAVMVFGKHGLSARNVGTDATPAIFQIRLACSPARCPVTTLTDNHAPFLRA